MDQSNETQKVSEERKTTQPPQMDIFAILRTGKELQPVINEKLKRCKDFKELQSPEQIPLSYRGFSVHSKFLENTPKEELVLEHVIQFRRQFQLHYDDKRELFLYPKNECDVYKFICTTIRPQKMGFLELYNYEICAKYMSYFISYEQLDPPDRFPSVIPSPTNVGKWQKGDSFDISILLCSLLIGVGYDAYCVYGTAPRSVTSKNEADLDYLYIMKGIQKDDYNTTEDQDILKGNEFAIIKKPEILSKFDTKKEEQDKKRKEEEERIAFTIDDDEPDEMGPDPYAGRRIHCWIMIKAAKRDVPKTIFVEPTTGRVYQLDSSPYLSIDAVFNHRNFWVNMKQDCQVKDLNFDEMDTSMNWEYVMLDTLVDMAAQQEEEAHGDIGEDGQPSK